MYFYTEQSAPTAQQAFDAAKGAGGPIASKLSFDMNPFSPPNPAAYAAGLVDRNWHNCADPAGPAGCFDLPADKWGFFGVGAD